MTWQKTIATPLRMQGVGLHTGEAVGVEMAPAPPNSGIVFVRTDLPGSPRVPASVNCLVPAPRRTALAGGDVEVHTVEHLLATLFALGIGNLEVKLDGPELPGLDGSALPYFEAIQKAGVKQQDAYAREIRLSAPIAVRDQEASVVAMGRPEGLSISYTLSYDSPHVATQYYSIEVTEESFGREIAPARTFVLEEETKQLQAAGLGKGASRQNTLVLGTHGVIDNELRFEDELVRHKILDLIGDLYLTNCTLCAHVVATKSGHLLNWELAKAIADSQSSEIAKGQSSLGKPGVLPADISQVDQPLDVRVIERILPHRYPFLLVDRVVEMRDGRYARGLKNVTFNEEFFQGHFPGRPVMPGVLQMEALAQLAGAVLLSRPEYAGRLAYLLSADKVKFRRAVVPGDQLVLEVDLTSLKPRTVGISGRAFVDGVLATEATMRFVMVESD